MALDKRFAVAIIFGIFSIPWTYIFGILSIPLWPSFIASASFFSSGAKFFRSYLNNFLGIAYAVLTIRITDYFLNGRLLWLSVIVGIFMFIGSLHYVYRTLSFLPAVFFGYATMFSVNAAGAAMFISGVYGQMIAAMLSMLIGALIGQSVDLLAKKVSA